jgi:ATP-dependent DNA ligase
MAIPEPMLSRRALVWPADGKWVLEPKWDGFRLLVSIDGHGCVRAWSRRGVSLSERLAGLLES